MVCENVFAHNWHSALSLESDLSSISVYKMTALLHRPNWSCCRRTELMVCNRTQLCEPHPVHQSLNRNSMPSRAKPLHKPKWTSFLSIIAFVGPFCYFIITNSSFLLWCLLTFLLDSIFDCGTVSLSVLFKRVKVMGV